MDEQKYVFLPSKLGVIVLDGDGEEVEEWSSRAIEMVSYYLKLREEKS